MDPRLLQYYNVELQHLREMGAEFAEQFPKIAARLGMNGLEVTDPYVERLIEGVGFLAARVHLKLDAEFPRFTQALLESVYPHYLAPTPSMVVAQLHARSQRAEPRRRRHRAPGQHDARRVWARTTRRRASSARPMTSHCGPWRSSSASYFSYAPDLPLNTLPAAQRIKGGVRIILRTTAGLKFSQTVDRPADVLLWPDGPMWPTGSTSCAWRTGWVCWCSPARGGSRGYEFLPAATIQPVGFSDNEALLPVTLRSFQGYRLLQEYFSFPQRFRFFELTGLRQAMTRIDGNELELVVLFGRGDPNLENVVDASNFALFCTPAINLFPKRGDRIHVTESTFEYHVVADRTRPQDFEVYEVNGVVGHGIGADSEQEFRPFYATYSSDEAHQHAAYFTTRREPRLVSAEQQAPRPAIELHRERGVPLAR